MHNSRSARVAQGATFGFHFLNNYSLPPFVLSFSPIFLIYNSAYKTDQHFVAHSLLHRKSEWYPMYSNISPCRKLLYFVTPKLHF